MVFKKKRSVGDYIVDGIEAVSDGVGAFARNKIDKIADNAELRFMAFQDRMMRRFINSWFFGVAIIFFSLGAFYSLKELFSFPDSISFFIIGIFLLIIGIVFKSMSGNLLIDNRK